MLKYFRKITLAKVKDRKPMADQSGSYHSNHRAMNHSEKMLTVEYIGNTKDNKYIKETVHEITQGGSVIQCKEDEKEHKGWPMHCRAAYALPSLIFLERKRCKGRVLRTVKLTVGMGQSMMANFGICRV